jgi:uncharacterized membrane protein
MSEAHHGISEKRFESVIGTMLRAGVILAAAIVVAGGGMYVVRSGDVTPEYRMFRGEATDLRYMHAIFADAAAGQARGLIQLGLLVLIATPIARVAFSVAAYFSERDWLYTVVTLFVLGVLIYSLTSA